MNSMPRGAFSSQDASPMKEKIPSGYSPYSIQQFTPEQMQLFQSLFPHLSPDSFLSRLASGDQSGFEEMEAPALKQFSGLQGNIASRFSGMGLGGTKSSGFQNTMNTAAQDFAQQLQSNRQNLRQQAITDLMGLSSNLLNQRPFEKGLQQKAEKQSSGFGSILGTALGGLGGFFTGGPAGAVGGARLGYDIGSSF